jgi:hypothetical protein
MIKQSVLLAVLAASTLAAAALAAPALADAPMTADQFESYVTGKTLTFGVSGEAAYGVEQYRANRQVTWSFLDGNCSDGRWYQVGENICFIYDFDPEPQCWQFFKEGGGLRAIFMNVPGTSVLYEAQDGQQPLVCNGLGV